jgi:tRNA(adenine34) deaminase
MCSFPLRETRTSRVVFAIGSPMMGGVSKWNVLRDAQISDVMPEAFGPPPEVIAGLCRREAEQVWRNWNPLAWAVIKRRGCLAGSKSTVPDRLPALPGRASRLRRLVLFCHRNFRASAVAVRPNGPY